MQALAPLVSSDRQARPAITAKLEDANEGVRQSAVQALAPLVSSDRQARRPSPPNSKMPTIGAPVGGAGVGPAGEQRPARQAITAKLEERQ